MKYNSNKKAFTLIELLVVISIIALLVSILMPALSQARRKARAIACMSNNRSIRQALSIYFTENDHKLLPYRDNVNGGTNLWMNSMLQSSGKVTEVLFCPEAPKEKEPAGTTGTQGENRKPWRWVGAAGTFLGSYGINGWLYGPDDDWAATHPKKDFTSAGSIKSGAEVPVFADAVWVDGWPLDTNDPTTIMNGADSLQKGYFRHGMVENMGRFWSDRHDKKISVSFFDGHAELVPLVDLWTLKWHKRFKRRSDIPEL